MKTFDFSPEGDKARMNRVLKQNPKEFPSVHPLATPTIAHAMDDVFGKASDSDTFVLSEEGAAYLKTLGY